MSAKTSFVICALALFVQSAVSQYALVAAAPDLSAGLGYNGLAASQVGLAYDGLAGWAGNGLAAEWAGNGLGFNGLAYDGLAARWAGNGLGAEWAGNGLGAEWAGNGLAAGWAGNGLGCNGLAYDGLAAGWAGNGLAYNGLAAAGCTGNGIGYNAGYAQALDFTPTSGGGLPVSSASANAPVGISVLSENVYEGGLSVVGELPFVGTVTFENVFPTAGAGVVNHACGNGINAMSSGSAAYDAGVAAVVPGVGIGNIAAPSVGYLGGCGCGASIGYTY